MRFQPVIGLEVHAQLLTRTKIFCGCPTAFGAQPNAHTCPVCLGMPGVLPVLNRRVVELAVRTGLALGCAIRPVSVFARKNYFYPDLPKGYQITQYDQPLCEHGALAFDGPSGPRTVRIARIHLEEDAGKSIHEGPAPVSRVDLNRAGVPLMEIVSEPDLRSADDAAEYLRVLRDVLVYLGVNDGNLEEGSFRCDANVSVMPEGETEYGTRVELKNINSFRFVKLAIEHEVDRQVALVQAGGKVSQQTRLWDPDRGETRPMRGKEEAHDYRYFPEPDLPPLVVDGAWVQAQRAGLPELPRARQRRFVEEHGLPEADAKVLVADRALGDLYDACAAVTPDRRRLANLLLGELLKLLNESGTSARDVRFTPAQLARLLEMVDQGALSHSAAKEVLAQMFREGSDPGAVVEQKGLSQVSDAAAIEAVVDEVLARNAAEAERYRAGKKTVFGFFVGQVMKAMKGKANPQVVNALLKSKLGE
jgi:aspartyl-tRNA(Asn)/glutamyl-tRNA(Gln) amidotransferase subunit B